MVQAAQTIRGVMKGDPITISAELTVEDARERMQANGIRHLPVLQGERLIGVISERDVARAEAVGGSHLRRVRVADAMAPDPYTCHPDEHLRRVVSDMAVRRLGCVVVVERGRVVGIFTTVDALQRLAGLCDVVELIAGAE